jgi:hypothetical protein
MSNFDDSLFEPEIMIASNVKGLDLIRIPKIK